MGKANRNKAHRRIFTMTIPKKTTSQPINTVAILAAWIRFDKIPEGQVCSICKMPKWHPVVARQESYETHIATYMDQFLARRKRHTSEYEYEETDQRLLDELFKKAYWEQQEKGPVYYETTWYCQSCFEKKCLNSWFGPERTSIVLADIKKNHEDIGFALYRRRTRPQNLVSLSFVTPGSEPDIQYIWEQRTRIETQAFHPLPGQRIVLQ
jgi:hypothetical protein